MRIMSLRSDLENVKRSCWTGESVSIRPLQTEEDLVYALFGCRLPEDQMELVNPASFSIDRAYLYREDNYPCIILNKEDEPVGFINLGRWLGEGDAYTWSFYIDMDHQGKGHGRSAAQLALSILRTAGPQIPVKLAAERDNAKAHRLYASLGFRLLPETDGDDLVFGYGI